MKVGVVFASTGGQKLVRAIRSLRKTEPNLVIHVALDIQSKTWKENNSPSSDWFRNEPGLEVLRYSDSTNHWINGTLNAAMRWMKDLGYTHACLFHDDIVFSPLPENQGHVSEWFRALGVDERLRKSSGLSFGCMEALVPHKDCVKGVPGHWHQHATKWDTMDLENEEFWRKLLPGGKPVGYFGGEEPVGEVQFDGWYVQYRGVDKIRLHQKLGPTGQIVPIEAWEVIGGFDEKHGLVYDMDYPVAAILKGLQPVLIVPNIPHLHLHNQSIGYSDLAIGIWDNCLKSFIEHYGWDPTEFWKEQGRGY